MRRNRLFPDNLGGYFDNLSGAMEAGVPELRDRQGAHGAAPGHDTLPPHNAAHALHPTGTNFLMLTEEWMADRR